MSLGSASLRTHSAAVGNGYLCARRARWQRFGFAVPPTELLQARFPRFEGRRRTRCAAAGSRSARCSQRPATDTTRPSCDEAPALAELASARGVGMPLGRRRAESRCARRSHRPAAHRGAELKHQHHLDGPAADAAHLREPLDDRRRPSCAQCSRSAGTMPLDGLGAPGLERGDLGEGKAHGAQR